MKRQPLMIALGLCLVATVLFAAEELQMETIAQKASYAVGMNVAKDMAANEKLDTTALFQGIQDALADKVDNAKTSYGQGVQFGLWVNSNSDFESANVIAALKASLNKQETALTEEEAEAAMQAFQAEMIAKAQAEQTAAQALAAEEAEAGAAAAAAKNAEDGAAFLAENKSKDGVKTTDSGLQYKVLTAGDGATPTASDTVTTHYTGKLIDGTVFDSSVQRGQPSSFSVGGVIAGWTEALQLMKVGDKWELYIPSELAYGANGAGGSIGPNTTLIFEIELISID